MEFEEFKEIDQVKPSERENEEKGGINIKHENSLSLFKMSNVANLQKAKVMRWPVPSQNLRRNFFFLNLGLWNAQSARSTLAWAE